MPSFVYRDGMTADKEYVEWLSDLKQRYKLVYINNPDSPQNLKA